MPLASKRLLGWLSWRIKRRHQYRAHVLEALLRDLRATAPDHLAVTGDLTNVALPEEFEEARRWLARLGPPHAVTLIPGNHDAYVRVPEARSWALWSDYLASDAAGSELLAELWGREKAGSLVFPTLRLVGPLALVGLCSAVPTAPGLATGRLGRPQLGRLAELLAELGARGMPRVLLVHHPPEPGVVAPRRALRDAGALGDVLRGSGAELVLHGHLHRTRIGSLPGPSGAIPVVGVRSASHVGGRPGRVARYHLYRLDPERRRFTLHAREYCAESDGFREVDEAPLSLG